MKKTQSILAAVVLLLALTAGGAWAQNPYDEETAVSTTETSRAGKPVEAIPAPEALKAIKTTVDQSNQVAKSDYLNYLVVHPIIRATVTFTDETKNLQRYAWFQQILGEHGVRVLRTDNKETKTGSLFNKKVTLAVSVQTEGRAFVLEALTGHYGGRLSAAVTPPQAPGQPDLQKIVSKETENQAAEMAILRAAFEVDRLLVARNKLGAFDFSERNRIDKALADLKERQIPAQKAKLQANHEEIRNGFLDLADKALAKKDYRQAIGLIELSRNGEGKAEYRLGSAYKGLGEYQNAIRHFETSSGNSYYREKARNDIADCHHLAGNDKEAVKSLLTVLEGFHGTQEELDALKKVDDWKFLGRRDEFPELPGQISGIYVEKTLQDAADAKKAGEDYRKAVEVLAGTGNKAEASRRLLGDFSRTYETNQAQLNRSRQAASQRFDLERERAYGSMRAWEQSYDSAVRQARRDYDYELDKKDRDLRAARQALDYLLKSKPAGTGGTDPYANSSGKPSTDPYATKPSSSTDPYATKPSTSTDPYAKKKTGTTDPYATSSARSGGTDPYAGSGNGGTTDPYGDDSETDPYSNGTADYESRLSAARQEVDRLDREYRWLYANESSFVDEKTRYEAVALEKARREYYQYELANKETYVSNDSEVKKYARLTQDSKARYQSLSQAARTAGY